MHHSPVHPDSCQCENRHVHRHRLNEEHQVAHKSSKNPPARVKSIRQGKGHAGSTHQHVGKRQVTDEEVGHVVHFFGVADDVKQQVVPENSNQDHESIARDDEGFKRLKELHTNKLWIALSRVHWLQHDFVDLASAGILHGGVFQAIRGHGSAEPLATTFIHPYGWNRLLLVET